MTMLFKDKSHKQVVSDHDWQACRDCFQYVGFTIGVKSGDAHIADTRVCEAEGHISLVNLVNLPNANERDILAILSDFPHGTLYITDKTSKLTVAEQSIIEVDTHEQRTVGFLFNIIEDPKVSKAARVWCERFGIPFSPATATVAT